MIQVLLRVLKQSQTNSNKTERRSGWNKTVVYFGVVKCAICSLDLDVTTPVSWKSTTGVVTQNPLGFSEDHIIPQSLGGTNNSDNLQPAHIVCNEARGNKEITLEMKVRLAKLIDELQQNASIETIPSNIIECKQCSKTFYAQNAKVLKYSKQYCSDTCRIEGLKTSVTLDCQNCQKSFTITLSRLTSGRGKYCSQTCYAESSGGVKRECSTCEKTYFTSINNNRKSVLLYCSKCRKNPLKPL